MARRVWFRDLRVVLLLSFLGLASGRTALAQDLSGERSVAVDFDSRAGTVHLAGTLALPAGEGPFPGAVLLGVAGPNDRDMSFPGHAPFRDLAQVLARRGVASLRWDDPGVGGSTGSYFQSTMDQLITDAVAGLDLLAQRPEVRGSAVGVIGNSEGAGLAPAAAVRWKRAAFVVMLGGPGLKGSDAILGQTLRLAEAQGYTAAQRDSLRVSSEAMFDVIEHVQEPDSAAKALRELMRANVVKPPEAAVVGPQDPESKIRLFLTPWYRSQISYDARVALRALPAPVLVMTGSLDRVLPADQNLPGLLAALLQAPTKDVTIRVVPGVNHIFQLAKTGLPIEYGFLGPSYPPPVADELIDWILTRVSRGE